MPVSFFSDGGTRVILGSIAGCVGGGGSLTTEAYDRIGTDRTPLRDGQAPRNANWRGIMVEKGTMTPEY